MTASNFDKCMEFVFKHEGGYVNDPRDAGGETNMGISKRSYPNEDIRNMTKARAASIYRRDYWNPLRCDELPSGLDLVAFDAAVNSGHSRAAKWLQSAVGSPADGKVGPNTISAAKSAGVSAVDKAVENRFAFLKTAKNTNTGALLWPTYKNGWTARVEGVRRLAKDMFTKPGNVNTSPVHVEGKSILKIILELIGAIWKKLA